VAARAQAYVRKSDTRSLQLFMTGLTCEKTNEILLLLKGRTTIAFIVFIAKSAKRFYI
jgi:hypothetical protein